MTRPVELFQGCDMSISIAMSDDISAATEVEFLIDCSSQISKTKTAGQITGVTATGFTVAIDAADTENIKPGSYKHQARATIAGKKYNIKLVPDKIKIMDSVFVDSYTPGDYG